jgi:hypothetical protein
MKDWMTSNTEANASRVHELTWWQEHSLDGGPIKIGVRKTELLIEPSLGSLAN